MINVVTCNRCNCRDFEYRMYKMYSARGIEYYCSKCFLFNLNESQLGIQYELGSV